MKSVGLLLILTAALAACGPTSSVDGSTTAPPEAFVAPAVPLVTADTDLGQASVVAGRASLQAQQVLTRGALPPELYDSLDALGLLELLDGPAQSPVTGLSLNHLSPLTVGRSVLGRLGHLPGFGAQGVIPVSDQLLPTGTVELGAGGKVVSASALPSDGLVVIDRVRGTTLTIGWKVGGAPTVLVNAGTVYDAQGHRTVIRQELPTGARLSVTRTASGQGLAAASVSMTPGPCLASTGPEALKLDVWAGNTAQPELKASADYAWNAQGLSLKASVNLSTKKGKIGAATDLKLEGATQNRCDAATFSFVPTRLDARASAEVPGDRLNATLLLRDVSNLEFSAAAMRVQNPFAKVQGKLSASADHNGQRFFSAFGPLADGPDLDLIPGDGVEVKYVQGGQVVTTNLQAFVVSLASLK